MTVEQINISETPDTHKGLKEALLRGDIEGALRNQDGISVETPNNIEEAIVGGFEFVEKMENPDSSFPHSPEFTEEMIGILDTYLSNIV